MGLGKRILEFFAAAAGIVFLMVLVWCLFSGFQEEGFEEQGTLVMNTEGEGMQAEPAFVTKPGFAAEPVFAAEDEAAAGSGIAWNAADRAFEARSADGL